MDHIGDMRSFDCWG